MNSALFSSAAAEWATPQWLFDALHVRFGFTLDVCAIPENAKLPRFFSPAEDALVQSWQGERCFCPPLTAGKLAYGSPRLKKKLKAALLWSAYFRPGQMPVGGKNTSKATRVYILSQVGLNSAAPKILRHFLLPLRYGQDYIFCMTPNPAPQTEIGLLRKFNADTALCKFYPLRY
jgi:hypothetical protein